jgi:RNA 2',3'-cyclic 3'-phosphodiesterase
VSVRAFVALEIPLVMRERIGALVESLKPELPGLRWLSSDTYHLTLRFLGPSSPEALAALAVTLRAAAAACPGARARVAGLGVFPSARAARVLWLGVALPPPLVALQAACEAAARGAGYPAETRPWRSHLTLGRWRDPWRYVPLPLADAGEVRLDRLVLFQSELRPGGAAHTPLLELPLR